MAGYPRLIADDWDGMAGPVDACLRFSGRNFYTFKGKHYWRYVPDGQGNPVLVQGYPREIGIGFPGLPDDLDTIFRWSGNLRIYAIKGK